MAMASYTKLRSGEWGATVQREDVKPGDRVVVATRSMKAHCEQVDQVIWRGRGVVLCSLVPRARSKHRTPRKSMPPPPTGH